MIILGIETSCDETALCLLEKKGEEYRILGNIVQTQMDLHKEYGGVFPMLAKREHTKNLPILYKKLIDDTGISEEKIDTVAVTQGPGLEPALWTGILFAREISQRLNKPLVPVNHMEGHIVASLVENTSTDFNKLKNLEFPTLAVLLSGGHTELVEVRNIGNYTILGHTVDDAIGEAFDKVARMLDLPYPGGPQISKLAEEARNDNIPQEFRLPRPMLHSKDLNFSFSGLKTSVLYTLKEKGNLTDNQRKDLAREFEDSVTEVIITKTRKAIEDGDYRSLIVGGGVIANKHIREEFEKLANEYSIPILLPLKELSGDNALMIALAASFIDQKTTKPFPEEEGFIAKGNLSF